jgi:hypothetical protein
MNEEKHPWWRPLKFKNSLELEDKINEYFNWGCRVKKYVVKKGKDYTEIELPIPTITWLALFLWFESRQSFYDYEERPEFSYTIKRARTFIEMEYEEMLRINPTWAIFALKNFWWKDKQEIDTTNLNYNKDITELSDEELNKLIN